MYACVEVYLGAIINSAHAFHIGYRKVVQKKLHLQKLVLAQVPYLFLSPYL